MSSRPLAAPWALVPLALLAAAAPAAFALSRPAPWAYHGDEDSLEWSVCRAAAVVRVTAVQTGPRVYRLTVLETFKGPAQAQVVVEDYGGRFPPAPLVDGREFVVVMDTSPIDWRPVAVLRLEGPVPERPVRTMALKPLRTREEMLAAVRAAVADAATAAPPYGRIGLALGPGFGGRPGPGGGSTFVIPRTDGARALALGWAGSPEPDTRANAVTVLGEFDAPDAIEALRGLLADPHLESRTFRNGERMVHPIRLAAAAALRRVKAPFAEPEFESPPWPSAFIQDHPGGVALAAGLPLVVGVAYPLARGSRRRRGRFVEPRSVLRTLLATAALVCTPLAGACAFHWWWGRVDGKIFVVKRVDRPTLALKSIGGNLQVLSSDVPAAAAAAAALPGPPPIPTADWGPDGFDWADLLTESTVAAAPTTTIRSPGLGFLYASATPRFADQRVTMVQVPFAAAVAVASLLPVVWLLRQRKYARRRRRADTGHCLACGYDLRRTRDRCPECGLAVAEPLRRFIPTVDAPAT